MRTPRAGDEVWIRAQVIAIDDETGSFEMRLEGLGSPNMTRVWAMADHFGKNVIAEDEDIEVEL